MAADSAAGKSLAVERLLELIDAGEENPVSWLAAHWQSLKYDPARRLWISDAVR